MDVAGVVETRLQNVAITLSKLKYCLKGGSKSCDISQAAPPLRPYSVSEIHHRIWLGPESLVRALLQVFGYPTPATPAYADVIETGSAENRGCNAMVQRW